MVYTGWSLKKKTRPLRRHLGSSQQGGPAAPAQACELHRGGGGAMIGAQSDETDGEAKPANNQKEESEEEAMDGEAEDEKEQESSLEEESEQNDDDVEPEPEGPLDPRVIIEDDDGAVELVGAAAVEELDSLRDVLDKEDASLDRPDGADSDPEEHPEADLFHDFIYEEEIKKFVGSMREKPMLPEVVMEFLGINGRGG